MKGITISFDLDGTICDTDWGWLDRIRENGWPEDEDMKYYACREKILDPYRFLGPDDTGIILTGRPIHLREITENWLKKNGMGDFKLVFTNTLPEQPNGTADEFKTMGVAKAKFLIENGVSVHFDDIAPLVEAMREASPDLVVIYTGYHVGW